MGAERRQAPARVRDWPGPPNGKVIVLAATARVGAEGLGQHRAFGYARLERLGTTVGGVHIEHRQARAGAGDEAETGLRGQCAHHSRILAMSIVADAVPPGTRGVLGWVGASWPQAAGAPARVGGPGDGEHRPTPAGVGESGDGTGLRAQDVEGAHRCQPLGAYWSAVAGMCPLVRLAARASRTRRGSSPRTDATAATSRPLERSAVIALACSARARAMVASASAIAAAAAVVGAYRRIAGALAVL